MNSPYYLSMRKWLEVSLELDNRAKIFNLFKDKKSDSNVQKQGRDIQGIIPSQYYSDRFEHDNLSSASWDWVFGPLIRLIFDLELATWVCLGHFEGGYSRWLYYFSNELSPYLDPQKMQKEEMRTFLRAYRCFSYNAWRKFTNPPILLTSTLMQNIMSANIDNEKFPQGASLFLSFKSDSLKSKKISFPIPYLWAIDLRKEAQRAKIGKKDREKILEEVCPNEYITEMVSNFLSSGGPSKIQEKIISFCPNENKLESILPKISLAADKYEKALRNIFNDQTTCLPTDRFSEELWKYYKEYRRTEVFADARLARYVVWLHDSVEVLTGILSIPAWLPPGSEISESASLIVCFKRPVSIDELRAIISAFRLGSSSISIRSERKKSMKLGEEKGEKKQKIIFVHEAKGLIDAILTDRYFEKLSNWGQSSAWHMRYLINIWGSIPLNTPLSITDGIVHEWAKLDNVEFLDKLIFFGIEHAIFRSDMAVNSEDFVGKEVKELINEILINIASPERQVDDLKNKFGFKVELENGLDTPGWIKRKAFIIMFHHCFWQAVYHTLRAYCKEKGEQKEYLKIYFSKTHCSIKNIIAEEVPSKIKDEEFFALINEKAENSFTIEKPEIRDGYLEIKIKFNVEGE